MRRSMSCLHAVRQPFEYHDRGDAAVGTEHGRRVGRQNSRLLHPFWRYSVINEWKWFVADTLVACMYCVIVTGYVMQHWEPGKVFYVGTLVMLLGYVNQFTSVFHDTAAEYNRIVQIQHGCAYGRRY